MGKAMRKFENATASDLRSLVVHLNCCDEGFNDKFTAAQLFKLREFIRVTGWDLFVDQLRADEVKAVLTGRIGLAEQLLNERLGQ